MFAELSLLSIFITGILTSILPCNYPLILGYLSLLLNNEDTNLIRGLRISFIFFLGFTLVYIFFGILSGLFGQFSQEVIFFNSVAIYFQYIVGVALILIGIFLLDIVRFPERFYKIKYVSIPKKLNTDKFYAPFLFGVIFATGYSPCIGPILGGVLFLTSLQGSVTLGAFYLFVFSLGLFVPIFVFTILYLRLRSALYVVEKFTKVAKKVAGILMMVSGMIILGFGSEYLLLLSEKLELAV